MENEGIAGGAPRNEENWAHVPNLIKSYSYPALVGEVSTLKTRLTATETNVTTLDINLDTNEKEVEELKRLNAGQQILS